VSERSDLVPIRREPDRASAGDAVEGDYLPPGPPDARPGKRRGLGSILVMLAIVFAKFKGLLVALLGLKWALVVLKLGWPLVGFVASVWAYSLFYGLPLAFVFVVLILVHELGHVAAMRLFGVPSSLPFFIPFIGAFVKPSATPALPVHEAWIALAGPLIGGLGAYVCVATGRATHDGFWIACAYLGFFLNLFNMLPALPFDGGRVVAAISPRMLLVGIVGLIAASIVGRFWNPLLLLIVLFSAPRAVAAWRGTVDPRLAEIPVADRAAVAVAYVAVAGGLLAAMLAAHVPAGAPVDG